MTGKWPSFKAFTIRVVCRGPKVERGRTRRRVPDWLPSPLKANQDLTFPAVPVPDDRPPLEPHRSR